MKKHIILVCIFIIGWLIFYCNKKPDLAVINFQFDDGCLEDAQIVEIFDHYNLKCGFALPSGISDDSRLEEYLEYCNTGGGYEILSHSTDGEGMSDDLQDMEVINQKLKHSKEILESCGFQILGWVTPSSQMNDIYKPLVKDYYEFAYTNYYGQYDKTCVKRPYNLATDDTNQLYRIDMYNSLTDIKLAIDETIKNKGFLTFYYHSRDLTEKDKEKLVEVLSYITEKINDGECVCLPPNAAYNYYFH